jgi:hypothetical protein
LVYASDFHILGESTCKGNKESLLEASKEIGLKETAEKVNKGERDYVTQRMMVRASVGKFPEAESNSTFYCNITEAYITL